jgi:hypothetical protein
MNKPPPYPLDAKTPVQAGRATAQSAVKQKISGDVGSALDLLGRYFFGDETVRQIAGLDPPTPVAPPNIEALVTPPPAASVEPKKEEPCSFCGTAPDGDIADRFIIRKDKKQIPCPGCLGKK